MNNELLNTIFELRRRYVQQQAKLEKSELKRQTAINTITELESRQRYAKPNYLQKIKDILL